MPFCLTLVIWTCLGAVTQSVRNGSCLNEILLLKDKGSYIFILESTSLVIFFKLTRLLVILSKAILSGILIVKSQKLSERKFLR